MIAKQVCYAAFQQNNLKQLCCTANLHKDYQETVLLLERIPSEVIWEYSRSVTGKKATLIDEHTATYKQQDIG